MKGPAWGPNCLVLEQQGRTLGGPLKTIGLAMGKTTARLSRLVGPF